MEMHLTRDEILRLLRAQTGQVTDNSLASQNGEQLVELINAAALRVQGECGWVNALRRTTVTIGIEQDVLTYPEDTRPGSIRAMAVYAGQDSTDGGGRYYPLESRVIPVSADTDQEVAAGQPTIKKVLGRPRYYQEREGKIFVWPRTDVSYPIRIEYMARADMPRRDSVCIVDGQLIVYAAAAAYLTLSGDRDTAARMDALYTDRLRALRGWQSAGTRFAIDSEANFAEDEFYNEDLIPRWDRSLTIAGSNAGPQP